MKFKMPKRKQKEIRIDGDVKIVEDKPPIYQSACQFLGYKDINAFFTYGDTIYNPGKLRIPNDIIIHERVHMKQQSVGNMTPALWWGKWFRDDKFRIDQEAQAYGVQFKALKTIHKDRNKQNQILLELAGILSGPLYKNAIDQSSALLLIKNYSER